MEEEHGNKDADQLLEIAELLAKTFQKDPKNIALWLLTPNPNFGGLVPSWMYLSGRSEKLLKLMRQMVSENELEAQP